MMISFLLIRGDNAVGGIVFRSHAGRNFGDNSGHMTGPCAILIFFAFDRKFDGEDMLTLDASRFVILARSMRLVRIGAGCVSALAILRWDNPRPALTNDVRAGRNCKTSLFARIHNATFQYIPNR